MRNYYVPDFEVKIEGTTLEADVTRSIIDLTYDNSLDTADMFTLRLNNAGLRFADSPLFDVGKNVEIYTGYVGDLRPMMLGEIAAVSPEFPESGAPTLAVTGYDKSYRMRHNRKCRTFANNFPSLVAAQIAAENLLIPIVDGPSKPFESMTQLYSDMEFLQQLADSTFFDVYVYWDRLYFQAPRPQTSAVTLEWGKNLSSFSPRLSTSDQAGIVAVLGYDSDLAQPIVGLVPAIAADLDFAAIDERLGSTFRDLLTSFGTQYLAGQSVDSFPDALTLGKAVVNALLEGLFEGSGACIGIPDLRAGKMVDIGGVGRRFSGKYRLRRVTHTIGEGGYRTSFEVTQRNSGTILQLMRRWTQRDDRMPGSLVATVLSNVDPERKARVLVTYPGLGGKVMNWAKVDPPHPGMQFMPNIGDDVVVVFDNGALDRPRIVARSWNVKKGPPETPTPANLKCIIQSRTGHTITLDDTPGSGGITLKTELGAKVTLADKPGGGITLDSGKGTTLHVDPQGEITVEAPRGTGKISINKNGMPAARKGDAIKSTANEDPSFWKWLNGFVEVLTSWQVAPNDSGAALKAALAAYLSSNPVPTALAGKITEGSQNVTIGE